MPSSAIPTTFLISNVWKSFDAAEIDRILIAIDFANYLEPPCTYGTAVVSPSVIETRLCGNGTSRMDLYRLCPHYKKRQGMFPLRIIATSLGVDIFG